MLVRSRDEAVALGLADQLGGLGCLAGGDNDMRALVHMDKGVAPILHAAHHGATDLRRIREHLEPFVLSVGEK